MVERLDQGAPLMSRLCTHPLPVGAVGEGRYHKHARARTHHSPHGHTLIAIFVSERCTSSHFEVHERSVQATDRGRAYTRGTSGNVTPQKSGPAIYGDAEHRETHL